MKLSDKDKAEGWIEHTDAVPPDYHEDQSVEVSHESCFPKYTTVGRVGGFRWSKPGTYYRILIPKVPS